MKILVVDREDELRPVLDLLENTPGNEVRSARTGDEAIGIAGEWEADLLITEVFIEPMNGFTLRNKMENRHPGIRTIFLTGYDLGPYAEHTAGYEVVPKPATPAKLFPAIARATAGGGGPTATAPGPAASPAAPSGAPPMVHHSPAPSAAPTQSQAPLPPPEPVAPAPPANPVAVPTAAVPRAVPSVRAVPRASVSSPAAAVGAPQVPRATPAAVPPVAVPRAVAAAAPPVVHHVPDVSSEPTQSQAPLPPAEVIAPTPPANPVAVPVARAMPAVRAVPSATPAAGVPKIAPPKAAAAPAARPATPVAVPRPAVAAAPAQPQAQPRPAVRAVAAVPKPADPLVGRTLGAYRIEGRLGTGKWGPVYRAIQTSMDRPVAMEILSEELQSDEAARQEFVATARAKAAVQHPHILSVYEADQADGRYFYTHEYVDGSTLAQLAARNEFLTEPTALQTMKFVAQALAYLDHGKVPHSIPEATDIYIGSDGLPHLSNVAQTSEAPRTAQEEIRALGGLIRSALPGGQAQDRGLQALLIRTGITGQAGFQSWVALFQAITAIEPKVVPADAFKLSAQDEAAIRAVEEARKRQKLQIIFSIAGMVSFLVLSVVLIWWKFLKPSVPDYSNEMVEIPAGEFIYQSGQKLTLPTFWIDKYEVTLAEYATFLEYLKSHDNTTEYDHPLQPHGRSHVPSHWEIYYGRASSSLSSYRNVRGVPLTLDCPVFNVDYFDAYAYAKWKGRRLPKQEEWEKAARGTNGNLYPWGNEWIPKDCNAGGDYQESPAPGYKPAVDGYTWWAPVTAFPTDKSPFGVIGMAGNVSEWTDTWDPGRTYVVIRGGNFKYGSENAKTTFHIDNAYPQTVNETLGFRTVSDSPPAK